MNAFYLYRLISIVSVGFTVALVIVMVLTFRKERRIGVVPLLLSGGLSLVMLPVFILLSGARLNWIVGVPLLLLGLLVGGLRGFATRLYHRAIPGRDGRPVITVVGKHSLFFLVGWGISLVLAQLLTLTPIRLVAAMGLMPLVLSTGTQVGITGNLLLRRALLRPPARLPSVPG